MTCRQPLMTIVNLEAVLVQTDDRPPRKRTVLRRLNLLRNGYDLGLLTEGTKPDFTTEHTGGYIGLQNVFATVITTRFTQHQHENTREDCNMKRYLT